MKSIDYRPIKDIDFTSGHGKKGKLDEAIDGDNVELESQITVENMEMCQQMLKWTCY